MNFNEEIPEMAPLFEGSDYIDVKTVEGNTSLRTTLPMAASNSKLSIFQKSLFDLNDYQPQIVFEFDVFHVYL